MQELLPQLTLLAIALKKCCSCVTRQMKKSRDLEIKCLISYQVKEENIKTRRMMKNEFCNYKKHKIQKKNLKGIFRHNERRN